MELITIILSGLLGILGNGGFVLNKIASAQLNSYVESADELAIRVDNVPNYQVAGGKVDRLRLAGRGLNLEPGVRIASLELETDAIDLDLSKLSTESLEDVRASLRQPLQTAFALEITQEDIAESLASEELRSSLETALNNVIADRAGTTSIAYELLNPTLDFQKGNKFSFGVTLRRLGESPRAGNPQELNIALDLVLESVAGKQILVTELVGTVNQKPISPRLLKGFAEGISDRLNLADLENQGIFARLLQLEVTADKMKVVGFLKLETKSLSVNSQKLTTIVK